MRRYDGPQDGPVLCLRRDGFISTSHRVPAGERYLILPELEESTPSYCNGDSLAEGSVKYKQIVFEHVFTTPNGVRIFEDIKR